MSFAHSGSIARIRAYLAERPRRRTSPAARGPLWEEDFDTWEGGTSPR